MKLEVGKFYRTQEGKKVGPIGWSIGMSAFYSGNMFYLSCGMALDDCRMSDLITEWTDAPSTGTLAEIGAQVGDVVECMTTGCTFTVSSIGMVEMYKFKDYRIVSRASELSKLDYKIINVEKPIYEVEPDTRPLEHFQSGPVITETTKRIVPGVYGKVDVGNDDGEWCVDLTHSLHGLDDLIAARDVFNMLIDAMEE